MTAGALTIQIRDKSIDVSMVGGGSWSLPIGPVTLVENELERADRPAPAQLTNALGAVHDHFDDVILDAPIVASTPAIRFLGRHAIELSRVEVGSVELPRDYVLRRTDAEEVFRTLVAEPAAERIDNPGLDPEHVESIIGTCCVILAIIRHLDLQQADIGPSSDNEGDTT